MSTYTIHHDVNRETTFTRHSDLKQWLKRRRKNEGLTGVKVDARHWFGWKNKGGIRVPKEVSVPVTLDIHAVIAS